MSILEFQSILNTWGQQQVPFLFVVDFELQKPLVWKASEIDPDEVLFKIGEFQNSNKSASGKKIIIEKDAITFQEYQKKFDVVFDQLCYGNSFLTNLTIKTRIHADVSLRDIFFSARAPFKLWYDDQFLVFSPEAFIKIHQGKIFSFPMKGTIEADIENAEEKILSDPKELAEHVTIVDLIRNDLSQVATNVHVSRFRYLDKINTNSKPLLQVSSEIVGDLPLDYKSNLGTILLSLLPAGSVSGAPKDKTLQIIKAAEQELRGYYTGVFGYFDGENLQSAVMIRYIEKNQDKYFYRSGGGITTQSEAALEYAEVLNKVYVPVV